MPRFQFIAFDLDGTLIDSAEDIAGAVNHVRKELGMKPLALDEVKAFVGTGVRNLLRGALGISDDQRITELLRLYQPYYAQHMLDRTRLYPGVLDLLRECSDKRIAMGVLSNKPQIFTQGILEGLKISQFFRSIIGGEAAFPKKPDPAALVHMLEEAKATRETTCYVGDSLVDWETAQNAGTQAMLVTQGFVERDRLVNVPQNRLFPTIAAARDFLLA